MMLIDGWLNAVKCIPTPLKHLHVCNECLKNSSIASCFLFWRTRMSPFNLDNSSSYTYDQVECYFLFEVCFAFPSILMALNWILKVIIFNFQVPDCLLYFSIIIYIRNWKLCDMSWKPEILQDWYCWRVLTKQRIS